MEKIVARQSRRAYNEMSQCAVRSAQRMKIPGRGPISRVLLKTIPSVHATGHIRILLNGCQRAKHLDFIVGYSLDHAKTLIFN